MVRLGLDSLPCRPGSEPDAALGKGSSAQSLRPTGRPQGGFLKQGGRKSETRQREGVVQPYLIQLLVNPKGPEYRLLLFYKIGSPKQVTSILSKGVSYLETVAALAGEQAWAL